MTRIALLSAATLIGAGALASSAAEARGGGALAAGLIGGLAAGALIGAATQARSAPGYGYGYPDDGYAPAPVVVRPAPTYRVYEEDGPVYAPAGPSRTSGYRSGMAPRATGAAIGTTATAIAAGEQVAASPGTEMTGVPAPTIEAPGRITDIGIERANVRSA